MLLRYSGNSWVSLVWVLWYLWCDDCEVLHWAGLPYVQIFVRLRCRAARSCALPYRAMLYCTVLYCTMLCCALLHYTVLCYALPCCVVSCCVCDGPFLLFSTNAKYNDLLFKVAELWYGEGADYNFESPGFSLSTRSFTQLIWLSSRKLGIGKASNNSGQCVIVARYEPVGNIDGLFVANVRRRGHERNSLEPMLFESDVKYRFKVEGRRSFRMSWEVEGKDYMFS